MPRIRRWTSLAFSQAKSDRDRWGLVPGLQSSWTSILPDAVGIGSWDKFSDDRGAKIAKQCALTKNAGPEEITAVPLCLASDMPSRSCFRHRCRSTIEDSGLPGDVRLMRHGVVVINTSRGNLLPAEKLLRALLSGKATAAGLDVWHHESLPVGHPRVIAMTPAAFYSDESLLELQTIAASQGAAALQRSRQNNSVNPTVLEGQQLRARFLTCARTSAEQPSGEAVEESTI